MSDKKKCPDCFGGLSKRAFRWPYKATCTTCDGNGNLPDDAVVTPNGVFPSKVFQTTKPYDEQRASQDFTDLNAPAGPQ